MSHNLSDYTYHEEAAGVIYCGDCLAVLSAMESESVQCCVTSPPYWGLRDYEVDGQLGLEKTPEEYVAKMVQVFREVRRVLKDDGVLWLNLGDSYATRHATGTRDEDTGWKHGNISQGYQGRAGGVGNGVKPKDLVGIPWMVAFALRSDGWYLRQDIIWHKPNPMPESVTDRCTKSHEYIFLMSKSARYYYDADAIKEEGAQNKWGCYSNPKYGDGTSGKMQSAKELTRDEYLRKYEYRNKRSVWTVATQPYKEAHFATFPPDLIKPCILAGSRTGDVVLDPFVGSGTTIMQAKNYGRRYVGIDLGEEYLALCMPRLKQEVLAL